MIAEELEEDLSEVEKVLEAQKRWETMTSHKFVKRWDRGLE